MHVLIWSLKQICEEDKGRHPLLLLKDEEAVIQEGIAIAWGYRAVVSGPAGAGILFSIDLFQQDCINLWVRQ